MPIYEYKCGICHQVFEKLLMGAEGEQPIVCPKCGEKRQVERLLSPTGIGGTSCFRPASDRFS